MKRYLQEKIAFIQNSRPDDEHLLIVPGAKTECLRAPQSRIYSIASPLVSRSARYRALLNLRALGEIIETERPDIIESADPYQVGWSALHAGKLHRIPVVAFYHSHFAEAYLRGPAARFGPRPAARAMAAARSYTRNLYNRFAVTLVPSAPLAEVLRNWGVGNVREVSLGVNTHVFHPSNDRDETRTRLGVSPQTLLLYVGRLAPEKNTRTLFAAFARLAQRRPNEFHLLVIGDGPERADWSTKTKGARTWIPYCADSAELAKYYRAADLFVHPGIEETFGLVALESQACGTPVVGIRGSWMDRVIFHEQEDWACTNTPEALAVAIEQMSRRNLSALGTAAAHVAAERHAWPRVFEKLFAIYGEVRRDFAARN